MDDFKYISEDEKRKLRRDKEKAQNGKRLFKALGLVVGGVALSTVATVAGLPAAAISMPIIIGSSLAGPLVANYFGQRRVEKYQKEYDEMMGRKGNR